MVITRSAAMALFLTLSLVLHFATGGHAAGANEPSASHRVVPEALAPLQGNETSRGRPPPTSDGHRHREINIGACFPSREDNNALSSNSDRGNGPSCIKRCTSKGYAGGRCDTTPDGFPGDCFCIVTLDGRA